MYQAETPVGLSKYKENEKGRFHPTVLTLNCLETFYQTT